MKKFIAITLTCILSITLLISGASGFSDCAVECQRAIQKTHAHAAMASANLRVPHCCSGDMQNTCEMNRPPLVEIPECSVMGNPTPSSNLIGFGSISGDTLADQKHSTQVDLRSMAGESNKTPPIYLRTLSILC